MSTQGIDAYSFCNFRSNLPEGTSTVQFGIDPDATAAALRELAGKIERGEIAPASARVITLTHLEDFTQTILRMSFHEKRPVRKFETK